ncbi:hypothetical protein HRbin33_02598 [bacterium HR33]|nr:hypothetical protein HRbin33_02598 [bacterium HR33]
MHDLRLPVAALLGITLPFCGDPRSAQQSVDVEALARELRPAIEAALGLRFKEPPAIAVRSREQVRTYLERKLDSDFPAAELEGMTAAYRLFGLLPDSLDLRALLLELYTEQVVGYYDPDSATLYVVEGADPVQLRLVLAHELVHGLQGQYLNLDSLLTLRRENDRRMAAQAVFEGQAMLASLKAMMPEQDHDAMPEFWQEFRRTIRAQQDRMPVFNRAPAVIREGLIFPYLAGADFVRWFLREYPDTVPFGRRLPQSTEHVLHPDRYREGDMPVSLGFAGEPAPLYDDGLGEFEIRILVTQLSGSESIGNASALGWAGDRYGVFPAGEDHALVWWTVWDSEKAARRFAMVLEREWGKRARDGRAYTVTLSEVEGLPAVSLVDAPEGWERWGAIPRVTVR